MSATMFRSTKATPTKKAFSPRPYRVRLPMLLPIQSSTKLLQDHRVTHVLPKLEQLLYTSQEKYHNLYLGALHSFAEYVQQLPSRHNFHFNHINGCLLLGLLRAYQTIRLYREQTPINSYGRDKVPANIALWSYALYTAALFLGVGEIYATYWISLCDAHGEFKQRWSSKIGPMTQYTADATHYRYSFEAERRDAIANLDTLAVAEKMLPKEGLAWIASDKYVYELWSAILTGDHGRAGPFAGFILPSEDIVLEQHQDLIESLEDFLLHEQRHEFTGEHSKELAIELANIENLQDLTLEQLKEIRESDQKMLLEIPGKTSSIYINFGTNMNKLSGDTLCFILFQVLSVLNYNVGVFTQLIGNGLAMSPTLLQVFKQAFPDFFMKLASQSLGKTVGGSLVFDPTGMLQNLPRQSPASPQNIFIPGTQPTNAPSVSPGPSMK